MYEAPLGKTYVAPRGKAETYEARRGVETDEEPDLGYVRIIPPRCTKLYVQSWALRYGDYSVGIACVGFDLI
jgi:hypothetical protein